MTLSLAWIRNIGARKELVVASDSRLSGGMSWDCCPKIILLPRTDCVLAFAGHTTDAYPLMLQFRNWLDLHPGARNRSFDINDLKKRMRLFFNEMRLFISDLPHGQTVPDAAGCEIIFGGWSWKTLQFKMWRFRYINEQRGFDFEPPGTGFKVGKNHPIIFAGNEDAIKDARQKIIDLLKERGRFQTDYLDMEPFEALRNIIRSQKYRDIGGAPQLVKIYQHGNTQPYAVKWDMKHDREISILGRPLFARETYGSPLIDPDNISFLSLKVGERLRRRKIDVRPKPENSGE